MPSALPGPLGRQGRGAAAADRPADQDRSRGAARLRQGRPRRDRDRPGAAGDVRDDDPVQAARRVARRHDAGQADRGARPARAGCRASPTSGCRRSATASTCSRPASRARSASRSPARTSPRSTRVAAQIERVGQGRAGRVVGARRARSPAGATSTSTIDRAAAARYGLNVADVQSVVVGGDRRRERRRDDRGPRALPDQRALPARAPRFAADAARAADRDRQAARRSRCRPSRRSRIADGPPMLRSENARLSGWIYVDIRGRDLRSVGHRRADGGRRARSSCRRATRCHWSGQFEYLERATKRLKLVVPVHAGDHLRAALPARSAASARPR